MNIEDYIDMLFDKNNTPFVSAQPQVRTELVSEEVEIIDIKREEKGEPSERYRFKEEQRLASLTFNQPTTSVKCDPDDDEDDDDPVEIKTEKKEVLEDVYQRYQFNLNPKTSLPIHVKSEDILKKIDSSFVVVLTALTGTGKTTQVPQYILEQAYRRKEYCNIVITQPRRIAAITVAKQVALERKCECGTLVGYQVGLDKQVDMRANSDTRILFCTTGVLLQKLINEKTMKRYTHVILDEVHERDIQLDMLLIVVRRLLATRNPYVKIILMSATLNSKKLASYFKMFDAHGKYEPAPIMDLNIPRRFPTLFTYLDSLTHLGATEDIADIEKPGISDKMYGLAVKAIELVLAKAKGNISPSFLVFLPGIHEINRFKDKLNEPNKNLNIRNFQISVLHSSIPEEDYTKAFDKSMKNKIILATNIAESSITLPVRFVIDFCLTKYQKTDSATNVSQLTLDWASKISLDQRAGRVGRTEVGQVIRLLFKHQFEALASETVPEIQRASLESVVLQAKRLDMGKPSNILALALDPPTKSAIIDSILMLKEIGGLKRLSKSGKFDENDGELTFAGEVMARLPIDVRISKLILLGYMFSCLEECIIIGAGMSTRKIFKNNPEQKVEEYHQKLDHAQGSGSDCIAILNAYREWRNAVTQHNLCGKTEKKWCDLKMLSHKNLFEMHQLIEEIKNRLRFNLADTSTYKFNSEEKLFAIKICIAGAFYPNYFAFGGTPPTRDDYKNLLDMNPCSTVYFKGMEQNRIGQIYEQQVRQKLCSNNVTDEINEMRVNFDGSSKRLQVQFKPITNDGLQLVPGDVLLEVYKAVKLGKSDRSMELKVMTKQNEDRYAIDTKLGQWKGNKFEKHKKLLKASNNSIYPSKHNEGYIYGNITHIVNCGKFFFQPVEGRRNIEKQQEILHGFYVKINSLEDVLNGFRLIVMHDQVLKRCKIIAMPDEDEGETEYTVFLIDYGSIVNVTFENFYICKRVNETNKELLKEVFELPPQCFQCRLSNIIPSPIKIPSGWSQETTEMFKKFIENKKLKITVSSFVDRVASVNLYAECSSTGIIKQFNEELIMINYAQTSDDSYLNLLDQNRRETEQRNSKRQQLEDELIDDTVIPPPEELLVEQITIDGPHSTLECKVEDLSRTKLTNVVIEATSVNHVLFDPFPNDAVKKLLVAATMSKREERVTLHQSTIMPHLPGIACLLSLMFSPIAEVRPSNDKTRYTSILTGLGCDKNRKPFYGEHDCLIHVDVELDLKDFDMIDSLRKKMSFLMKSPVEIKNKQNHNEKKIIRNEACSLLTEIAKKPRSQLGLKFNSEVSDWNWRPVVKIEQKDEAMYPALVKVGKLIPLSENTKQYLKNHAEDLEQQAATNAENKIIKCKLCDETVETLMDLKLHVMKKLHKERKVRIREEEEQNLRI